MKTINELLSEVQALGVRLWNEEERLRYSAPKGVMTADLRQELKERKAEILRFLQQTNSSAVLTIEPVSRESQLPLSFAQQRLWFLEQIEPNNPFYNLSRAVKLSGELDIEVLQQSLDAIVAHHEILRTNYHSQNGNPIQVIAEPQAVTLQIIDLQLEQEAEREVRLNHLLQQESQRPFNLESDMMLRGCLVQLSPQEQVLLLVMHHIASDGWSMGILWGQLTQVYQAFLAGKPNPLPPLPIQYADYAVWQRNWLSGEVLDKQLNYWKRQLADANPVLELPTDRSRPTVQTYHGAYQAFSLPQSLSESLKQLCRQEGVTLYMTLLAAFQTLLYRYSRQKDIVVGSPIAGRNRAEIEGLIGFFVNTLVLRTDLSGNPSFRDLLAQVRSITLDAYSHQDLPFEKLVEELNPERSLSYSPLFQVMFVFQNAPGQAGGQLLGLTETPVQLETDTARFDFILSVSEKDGVLAGSWNYNIDLFDAATIERINAHFQILLEAIVDKPQQPIDQLPLLTADERQQLIWKWNDTYTDYPQDKCIHQLFEEQVERTPDSIAVVFQDRQITYRELNERANQLAHYLQSLGVKPETLVGICIERSLEMVVSLLGILKAGGSYVPLDPTYPYERLRFTIEDSQLAVLLTQETLCEQFSEQNLRVICIDRDGEAIARQATDNCNSGVIAENLAYTIYTSGSTGKPKGVQICHRAAVNFLNSMRHEPGLTADDCLLAVTTISFDIAVLELYLPLLVGASILLATSEIAADAAQLSSLLASGATVMQATPATWKMLVAAGWQGKQDLKILCGGEAMTRILADLLLARSASVWNMYGPTETTVWSSISQVDCSEDPICIGLPIANTQFYILDEQQQPVPLTVPGELYIGGAGLARGYLNQSKLTSEKFISNPFNNESSDRLYRTGDLAKYLPNDKIELIGRIDNQVKIRGFRIELGEIEAVLSQHRDLRETAVVAREDIPGDKRLVAYIVPQQEPPSNSDLRSFVQQRLPDYMIPSAFVFLNAMPLTPNGKINRRALPAPDLSSIQSETDFVLPRNSTEKIIADIWSNILGVARIGIKDNFFDLGGHSLLATRVISKLNQTFSVELSLRHLFERPTVIDLSTTIIAETQSESTEDEEFAELLSELEELSDEEVKQLLARENS